MDFPNINIITGTQHSRLNGIQKLKVGGAGLAHRSLKSSFTPLMYPSSEVIWSYNMIAMMPIPAAASNTGQQAQCFDGTLHTTG